jgi:para-nitrobenzyl esterase
MTNFSRRSNSAARYSLAAFFLLTLCAIGAPTTLAEKTSPGPLVVRTETGSVRGALRDNVREFRGIPYAASTAGQQRWTLPQPAPRWQGTLDGTNFRDPCPQVARFNLTEASNEENCLTVNVSTPALAVRKAPVLVYIHGGAWVGGSASLYRLDALARTGLVVVSVNYRLGALGFLAHTALAAEGSGAWGIADQRAALRWVQRNIAAFGGDPGNVTIGGESAGAGSVCIHLANAKLSKGLFHKAIVQSGGCLYPRLKVKQAEELGLKVAAAVGCNDTAKALACLRAVPLEVLLKKQTELASGGIVSFAPSGGSAANPVDSTAPMAAGDFLRVPVLMGATRDEMRLYVAYDLQAGKHLDEATYPLWLQGIYGRTPEEQAAKVPEKVAAQYPVGGAEPVPAVLGTAMTDFMPSIGIGTCLQLHTGETMARYTDLWQWEFADRNAPVLGVGITREPDPGFLMGAVHAAELNYWFPNFDNTHKMAAPNLAPASQALSNQMLEFVATFARTGRPAAAGLPEWPRHSDRSKVMWMEPGKTGLVNASEIHHCAFWKSLYPNRL